jgi:hypothetical protein
VHEQNALRAALLPAAGVGILVALPGHIIKVVNIGAQDLPVKARVLQEHLQAVQEGGTGKAVQQSKWVGGCLWRARAAKAGPNPAAQPAVIS